MVRRLAVSAVLEIIVGQTAELRKRTRGDEDDSPGGRSSKPVAAIDGRFWNPRHERTYVGLTPLLPASHECADLRVNTMQLETKFLRLRTSVTLGSRFGDWHVCWLGGWQVSVVLPGDAGEDPTAPHAPAPHDGWPVTLRSIRFPSCAGRAVPNVP